MYAEWECTCNCHLARGGNVNNTFGCCTHCSTCEKDVKIGMEDLHNKNCRVKTMGFWVSKGKVVRDPKKRTLEEQAVVDDAKDIMAKVLVRIEQSTRQYGTNYILADVMKETEEEMLDIVGWPLLEVIRMRQLFLKKLGQLDGKYLDKFLKSQTAEYLSHLKEKIDAELVNRQ